MKAIPNPEYEACRKHLCVGYQNCGVDLVIAIVDATAKATPEEVDASWKRFDEIQKNYDAYKRINTGPVPL